MPGHEIVLLITLPPDELICIVCYDLFKAPVFVCAANHTLCKGCADSLNPRKCPMCNDVMKPADALKPNRMAANMIDKMQIRCVNRSTIKDNGNGGLSKEESKTSESETAAATVSKDSGCDWIGAIKDVSKHMSVCGLVKVECASKIDGCKFAGYRRDLASHSERCLHRRVPCMQCQIDVLWCEQDVHAASECPKRVIFCPNDGCEERFAAEAISAHRNESDFELLTCNFAGICKYTYTRGDGRDAQDGKSLQTHLNLAMRTIDTQTRKIEQLEEQIASTKLHLNCAVDARWRTSDTIWFGGSQILLQVGNRITDSAVYLFLYQRGPFASPTYRQIDVFFKGERVASITDVKLSKVIMMQATARYCRDLWKIDAIDKAAIKDGADVHVIIYR
jgi:hypothetical protein